MIGIYDFAYGPYSLGDALTGKMNLAALAEEHGCAAIDQYLLIDEKHLASRRLQPLINALNYVGVIDNFFPVVLCWPMLRSLKLYREGNALNHFLFAQVLLRRRIWQSLWPNHTGIYGGTLR